MITRNELRELLFYNPKTGEFFWRVSQNCRAEEGDLAGTTSDRGYIRIMIKGKLYRAHRIAWLYMYGITPPNRVDHINRNTSDNRIVNLRLCNQSENSRNASRRRNNTSGCTGVSWNSKKRAWVATISDLNGKILHLVQTKVLEDAIKARKDAEKDYGYSPTHGEC